jgi:hypothetical protein
LLACIFASPVLGQAASPPAEAPAAPAATPAVTPAPAIITLPQLPASTRLTRTPAAELASIADDSLKPEALRTAVSRAAMRIVALQEGWQQSEWPYEGVYRVGGNIPVGYRIGGTAIGVMALLQARPHVPEADRPALDASITKAADFIIAARTQPLLSVETYQAGYDVRGWAAIYALHALSDLHLARTALPRGDAPSWAEAARTAEHDAARAWYLDALQRQEMPKTGGWNYARPRGVDAPGAPSSFMTATAIQALLRAKAAGQTIDPAVLQRGLDVLDKTRNPLSGEVAYSGFASARDNDGKDIPGATGRMCVLEATLALAGDPRASVTRLASAVDAFVEHWDQLDVRRTMTGTHVPPYGVAPYYFMFAHRYAAQAVELLPADQREARRAAITRLLFRTISADGTWNDRIFARSANFGSSFAILAMTEQPALARAPAAASAPAPAPAPGPAIP